MDTESLTSEYFKHLDKGSLLMEIGRWDEACKEYGSHLSKHPDDYDALTNLSVCNLRLSRYQKALDYARRAASVSPNVEWAYRIQSSIFQENGEYERAVQSGEKALAIDPENPYVLQVLAQAYINFGSNQKAFELTKRLLEITPDSSDGYNLMGLIAIENQQYETAEEYFKYALKIDPEHSFAMNNLGVAYLSMYQTIGAKGRKYKKLAQKVFRDAAKLDPTLKIAQSNIKVSQSSAGDYDRPGLWIFWIALFSISLFIRQVLTFLYNQDLSLIFSPDKITGPVWGAYLVLAMMWILSINLASLAYLLISHSGRLKDVFTNKLGRIVTFLWSVWSAALLLSTLHSIRSEGYFLIPVIFFVLGILLFTHGVSYIEKLLFWYQGDQSK